MASSYGPGSVQLVLLDKNKLGGDDIFRNAFKSKLSENNNNNWKTLENDGQPNIKKLSL